MGKAAADAAAELLATAKFPVILEHEHYHASKQKGAWRPDLLLKSVEDYHASFMSIHGFPKEYLAENREMIDWINKRMGYRLFEGKNRGKQLLKIADPPLPPR